MFRNRTVSYGFGAGVVLALAIPLAAQQTGTAVYYSDRYEGRRMANGEALDQTKMTASHKTYPYGSLVKVVNLANEKSVTVRVTDRPSTSSKALIELTRGAAEKLDFLEQGTARVRVEVVERGDGAASQRN